MVGGAVAFDASEVPSREIRMDNPEIDPEERYADLGWISQLCVPKTLSELMT